MKRLSEPADLTLEEIRAILSDSETASPEFLALLAQDPRQGVHQLVSAFQRRRQRALKLADQWCQMCRHERAIWDAGGLVCGVDEAGRGPLAGPVVAAAVIIPPSCFIPGLTDSKALSAKQRAALLKEIIAVALDFAVGVVEPGEIDRVNILQATQQAMYSAVSELSHPYETVFIDGNLPCRLLDRPQQTLVKGDALSVNIAAASIIAKETRDEMMIDMDRLYPGYGFAEHKGYGTPQHLEALSKLGPSPIHRRSFAPVSGIGTSLSS